MLKSQSLKTLNYQNITSRIHKIKATANARSNSLSKSRTSPSFTSSIQNFTSRSTSAYKTVLKSQPNGMFGIEVSNKQIGKVQKNIGIKKYNQMQIKEILYRNSARIQVNQNYCKANDLNLGNQIKQHMLSPRFSCPQPKQARQTFIPFVPKTHSYQRQVPQIQNNKIQTLLPTSQYPSFGECEYEPNPIRLIGNLQPGKIYNSAELARLLN